MNALTIGVVAIAIIAIASTWTPPTPVGPAQRARTLPVPAPSASAVPKPPAQTPFWSGPATVPNTPATILYASPTAEPITDPLPAQPVATAVPPPTPRPPVLLNPAPLCSSLGYTQTPDPLNPISCRVNDCGPGETLINNECVSNCPATLGIPNAVLTQTDTTCSYQPPPQYLPVGPPIPFPPMVIPRLPGTTVAFSVF